MNFKSRFYITAALLFGVPAFVPFTSAQAGQLFPPANIGSNPNIACPSNQVLAWTGQSVACVNPTPGVSVSCPAKQMLVGIASGSPVCINPTQDVSVSCASGQALTGIVNGVAQCAQLPVMPPQSYLNTNLICSDASAGSAQIAILSYYTKYLGRCADSSGFGYWSNANANGGATLMQIQQDIATSPEAASYAESGVNDAMILSLCAPLNGVSYHYRQFTQYCDPD
jgi:hypothetical protein